MPPTNLAAQLAGVFAPISTPFDENEEVDYAALQFNMAFYASSGLRGYLALGSNGENRSLSEDEKRRVLASIIKHKGPEQVVMAGATYDAQRETERFLERAAGLGADFGLVLPPGYFRKQMTEEVLYRYYSTLAERSRIPILLYNAPGFCGVTITPALAARLAVHPKIVGMKELEIAGGRGQQFSCAVSIAADISRDVAERKGISRLQPVQNGRAVLDDFAGGG